MLARIFVFGAVLISGLLSASTVQAEQQIKTFTAEEFDFGRATESSACRTVKMRVQTFAQNPYSFQSELGADVRRVGITRISDCACTQVSSPSKVKGWSCDVDAYLDVERG